MNRKHIEAEQTRQRISDTAKAVFSQKGYTATSMDEICTGSGVSKGSLYYHFKSKEDLFFHILDLHTKDWIEKWTELSHGVSSARARLLLLAEHYALDFENPLNKAAEEFSTTKKSASETIEKLIGMVRRHYPLLREILEAGIENGELQRRDDLEDVIFILNGLLSGLAVAYYQVSQEQLIALHHKAIEIFLNGISPQSS
jgi:AcrR family transcriptional regulator